MNAVLALGLWNTTPAKARRQNNRSFTRSRRAAATPCALMSGGQPAVYQLGLQAQATPPAILVNIHWWKEQGD